MVYKPWGRKEPDTTELLSLSIYVKTYNFKFQPLLPHFLVSISAPQGRGEQ